MVPTPSGDGRRTTTPPAGVSPMGGILTRPSRPAEGGYRQEVIGLSAPTPADLFRPHLDPLPALALVALAVAYLAGVRRLAVRGRLWPAGRTAAFLAGVGTLAVATQSGLAAYDTERFSVHVSQHLLLSMVAPPLLALAGPITLLLQAGSPTDRRRLLRVLHSRPVAVATHPLVAWSVFAGSLAVLYFSPLFELSLRNTLVHDVVHLHFLVSGCLFAWLVVGVDPLPRRPAFGVRLLAVLLALPVHALLGVALLGSRHLLAADWYSALPRSSGGAALADQQLAGGLLWVAGDLLGLLVAGVVVVQWMNYEQRVAAREDRRAGGAPAGPP